MLGKKGVEAQHILVALIIAAIILFLLFLFAQEIGQWISNKGSLEACRLSVLAASQIGEGTVAGSTAGSPVEIECTMTEAVIYADEKYYTVDGAKRYYLHEKYADNVKQAFSQQMAECWHKMGEGKVDGFSNDAVVGVTNVCFHCGSIWFDEPGEQEITGFEDYLRNQPMIASFSQQSQETYYDYMNNVYDVDSSWIHILEDDPDRILPSFLDTLTSIHVPDTLYEGSYRITFQVLNKKVAYFGIDENMYMIHLAPAHSAEPFIPCEYYYE